MPPGSPPATSLPAAASPSSSRHSVPPPVASASRRDAFPFSFSRPHRANPSSTSLVPSTAEGKPIPLDNSIAEYRTSALREINSHYPSRHQYTKSSLAQSSTYSEPVIVRTYHPSAPGRRLMGANGAGCVLHGSSTSASGSDTGIPRPFTTRRPAFASKVGFARNGMLGTIALARASKGPAVQFQRLPPVEAFSFRIFMANVKAQGGGGDINVDLNRIAEICARSRYSLSNQYEVHYAPHGSGSTFLSAAQQHQEALGPTLQAVSSDDERNMKPQRRKRHAARRNSRAMGTLETIMSSSRSSDEEKSKQKSAAELADQVRGRASWKESHTSSPTASSGGAPEDANAQTARAPCKTHARRPSTSLALIDGSRQSPTPPDVDDPRSATNALVGEPALPQASTSQLEIRTAREQVSEAPSHAKTIAFTSCQGHDLPTAQGSIPTMRQSGSETGLRAVLGGWIP